MTLNKVRKGCIPSTVDYYMKFTGKLLDEPEAEGVNKMLISVFNAGKGGYINKKVKDAFARWWKLCPMKIGKTSALNEYAKKFDEVGEDVMYKGLLRKKPEMLAKIRENTVKFGASRKHEYMLHPCRMIKESFWEEFEINETKPKEPEVIVRTLTVDDIMGSIQGQTALEQGVGASLLDWVNQHKELPDNAAYKALRDKARIPPTDDIGVQCLGIMKSREAQLKFKYYQDQEIRDKRMKIAADVLKQHYIKEE